MNDAILYSHSTTALLQPGPLDYATIGIYLLFVLAVVQRALAAKDINAAQRTPLIAAIPKIFFPFLVILPGLLALPLLPHLRDKSDPSMSYNNALPLLMGHYYPAGRLGLAALAASFISGMAGNTTAFNTVFTYILIMPILSEIGMITII